MATIRQKNLVNNIVSNIQKQRWKTLKDLLIASGFSLTSATQNTKAIIQSKGVQNQLVSIGFNEDVAKAVVSEILLLGSENNRLRAAQEIFKVSGTYAPEKSFVITGDVTTLIDKMNKYEKDRKSVG